MVSSYCLVKKVLIKNGGIYETCINNIGIRIWIDSRCCICSKCSSVSSNNTGCSYSCGNIICSSSVSSNNTGCSYSCCNIICSNTFSNYSNKLKFTWTWTWRFFRRRFRIRFNIQIKKCSSEFFSGYMGEGC